MICIKVSSCIKIRFVHNHDFLEHKQPSFASIYRYAEHDTDMYMCSLKGVLHLWALFLKTLCIFSKNKATSDKVSYGSGQKCSKELENYSFTSVETIVVKLQ